SNASIAGRAFGSPLANFWRRAAAFIVSNMSRLLLLFLGKDVIAAHGCWLDPAEIEVLAHTGAKVAHCPISNMKLATGAAMPYPAMKEAAVSMGLGTDGAASNNSLDMFETMKAAALLQKFASGDPKALPAIEAFEL